MQKKDTWRYKGFRGYINFHFNSISHLRKILKKILVREQRSSLRPYHPERAQSRLISEAKQGRAWLVLGWENREVKIGEDEKEKEQIW